MDDLVAAAKTQQALDLGALAAGDPAGVFGRIGHQPARQHAAGKSLLPAGVTEIEGEFKRGDVVDVKDRAGRVLARGLVAYAAEDARRIAGRKSAEIERLLGFRGRDEIVHRDDLVVE